MIFDNKKIAGLLFFVGAAQLILMIIIAESLYSGYSVGSNFVSDLGNYSVAGTYPALIFNISVIMLGILLIAGSYFINREFKNRIFTSLLIMAGVSVIGVGVFSEDIFLLAHAILSLGVFMFATGALIMSSKFEKSPLSYASLFLGAIAAAIFGVIVILDILLVFGVNFDIGYGGLIERFMLYPEMLGLMGFGAYLLGESSQTIRTIKT
jgi:hypothetical membrane protein